MTISAKGGDLRIELDTKNCTVGKAQVAKMEGGLTPLRDVVRDFPVKDLYVTVFHFPRSGQFHVKTSLVLTGKTLFTGEKHELMYAAFERCIRKLVKKVEAYKQNLGGTPERDKHREGTRHEVLPAQEADPGLLEGAVSSGDYAAFRRATYLYEEPLRNRVGRWVQRYPEVDAAIGDGLQLDDIVEEVFLTAFDQFEQRPRALPLGDWLENLIDPSLKALVQHPDDELENVRFARAASEIPQTD
jgi:ribosome-associated translation inhibitor RaiA